MATNSCFKRRFHGRIIFPFRRVSQAVRQRFAKPLCTGSNPVPSSCFSRRSGGIGRHKGLKIPRFHNRAGSSPASGTVDVFMHSALGSIRPCTSITAMTYAKVNFYLHILQKLPTGYHNLHSLFQSISLHDCITIQQANRYSFNLHRDSSIKPPENSFMQHNLVTKTYQYFRKHFKIPSFRILLEKHIPIGAGLGGGSSNVAGVIHAFNALCALNLNQKSMMDIASLLGSDVPFATLGGLKVVSGTGEAIHSPPKPMKRQFFCVVLYPEIYLKTSYAYQHLVDISSFAEHRKFAAFKDVLFNNTLSDSQWLTQSANHLLNSFQDKTFKKVSSTSCLFFVYEKDHSFCVYEWFGFKPCCCFYQRKFCDSIAYAT